MKISQNPLNSFSQKLVSSKINLSRYLISWNIVYFQNFFDYYKRFKKSSNNVWNEADDVKANLGRLLIL